MSKKIEFHKEDDSRANTLWLEIMFEGGDADTEHPEEYRYKNHTYSDWKKALPEIEKDLEMYKKLKNALDCNHKDYCDDDYEKVKEKFGEEVAELYDGAPNDPQVDYSRKCYVDSVCLSGYDETGAKFKTYDLL